jgi:uncharacterized protein YlaI
MKRTQDRIRQDVFMAINRLRDKIVMEYWCDKCNHRHQINSMIGQLHKKGV